MPAPDEAYGARHSCASCGGELVVTHTYSAGSASQARTLKCRRCGQKFTQVSFLLGPANKRGEGAEAVAARLRKRPV